MPTKKERNALGRFVETWMFQESPSAGGPPEKLFLPKLPPPWKSRWYVKRGCRYFEADRGYVAGERVRIVRRTIEACVAAVAKLEREIQQHGALALALSTQQRYVAAQIFAIAERLGVDPLAVFNDVESRHPKGANGRTLEDVRVELIEKKAKLGRSERHVKSLDYRLRQLIEALGNKPIISVTTTELADELERHRDWKPVTIHSVVQGWKIFFNFAIRREYLTANPADRLELPKVIHDEPEIFTVEQVRRLMAATLFSDRHPLWPACRAYLAIGLFSGLRPDEIGRLCWEQVDLGTSTIRVKAANAKDRDRRIVEIQPNLAAWLRPLARDRGPVLSHPLSELRVAARQILGLAKWPHDIMRHTFVSYHFAEFRSEAHTKREVGHRDDGRIFYNHYMVPVSRADARLFWATIPPVGLLTSGGLAYEDGLSLLRAA